MSRNSSDGGALETTGTTTCWQPFCADAAWDSAAAYAAVLAPPAAKALASVRATASPFPFATAVAMADAKAAET
jgi:hypothetical protein